MNLSKKQIIATCLGTTLEWTEFTFYAYIALTISKVFFPHLDKKMGIVASFSIFAIGYLVRPLGSIVFGYLGDHQGRRSALQWSIFLMGLSSLCIGILPGYANIGHWSPILLLIFRCTQSLAVSGEFNGSSIFLMEHSTHSPHLAASWTGWAAAIGMLIGSAAALIIALPYVPFWAWRLPFLSGAFISLLGLYVRQSLKETPIFLKENNKPLIPKIPLLTAIRKKYREIIVASILSATLGIYVYIANVFYATHLIQSAKFLPYQAKLVVTTGSLFTIVFYPWAAKLADKYGGEKIIRYGLISIIFTAPLIYLAPLTHSLFITTITQMPYALADALFSAPLFKVINTLFPAKIRYTGASFSWNISMAIFGGTAPLIATWLQSITHLSYAPAFYVIIAALMGLTGLKLILSSNIQQRPTLHANEG